MAFPHRPIDFQRPGHPIQASVQALAEPHHVLHVVNHFSEKHPQSPQEFLHPPRQAPAREDLHQVPEIVRAVKGDPADRVVAHQARGHHQLGEPAGIYAVPAGAVEIDALAAEKVDGVGSVGVARGVEVGEVELPDEAGVGPEVGEVAAGVGEGEAELDEAEGVDVGFEEEVVVGGQEAERVRPGGVHLGPEDDAGKLGVHGDEGKVVDEVADELELGFDVVGPDLPDCYGFRSRTRADWIRVGGYRHLLVNFSFSFFLFLINQQELNCSQSAERERERED